MTALLTDEAILSAAKSKLSLRSDVPPSDSHFFVKGCVSGAVFARSIYEARLAEEQALRAQLVEALEACEAVLDEASFTSIHASVMYTNAYASTVAALAAAEEIE